MSNQSVDGTPQLADFLALVYHEARNVRHLIEPGFLGPTGWEQITNLPRNRVEAWKSLQQCRNIARGARTAHDAALVFQKRFCIGLDALINLFANQHWRHARMYGGNAWVQPARCLQEILNAIDGDESERAAELMQELSQARHNTGLLVDKVHELDRLAGIQRD